MFPYKGMFRRESKSECDESSKICIVQLTYDFEERLLGCSSTLPIISSLITVHGLGFEMRGELGQKFPCSQSHKGYVEIGEDLLLDNKKNNNYETGTKVEELGVVMKSVTSVLSFLRMKEFLVASSTVDSSSFSGYVNKTYCWTLQKL